jgi:glycosyltransferase involved in cell wall biosynthesis
MVAKISVIIPALNESDRLSSTVRSFIQGRRTSIPLEFVIVDDGSSDGCCLNFAREAASLCRNSDVSVVLCGLAETQGNYAARNVGASQATGDILFMTDAHVSVFPGWDNDLVSGMSADYVNTTAICSPSSSWAGYGCRFIYPDMSTKWNTLRPAVPAPVAVAPCAGTIISRRLFCQLGGYDPGMRLYFSGEAEFSVRAWLSGVEVRCLPAVRVAHRFKKGGEYSRYTQSIRSMMIHNALRFSLLYLEQDQIAEVNRYYRQKFPAQSATAMSLLDVPGIKRRRAELQARFTRDFTWYRRRFQVTLPAVPPVPVGCPG